MGTEDPGPQYSLLLTALANHQIIWLLWQIGLVLLLLFLSGLISGAEVAFFSIRPEEFEALQQSTENKDQRVARMLSRPRRLLATILIFNNFINVAIVIISTVVTWTVFDNKNQGIVFAVISFVVTFLIVFFGEILPKVYASNNHLVFAHRTSRFIKIIWVICTPLSLILIRFSRVIERRIKNKGYNITVEDLHEAVHMTTSDSSIEEKEILKGIVNFSSISVKQIMRSRIDITAFDQDLDFHQLMDKVNKCGYSRIPVYKERIDNMKGILYMKDLLPFLDQDEHFAWQKLMREGYYIPETKKIDDLLKDFKERRVHMAIVVDEYGGTSGLITMEDIIEEIVGEINDEFDDEDINYSKIDDNTFVFEGKTSLNDLSKVLDLSHDFFDEVKGESESLGGLLLELNSSMPQVGEKIIFEKFDFIVESVNNKRIKRVRIVNNETVEDGEEGDKE